MSSWEICPFFVSRDSPRTIEVLVSKHEIPVFKREIHVFKDEISAFTGIR